MWLQSCCGSFVAVAVACAAYLVGTSLSGAQVDTMPQDSPLRLLYSWASFRAKMAFSDLLAVGTLWEPPYRLVNQVALAYQSSEVLYALTYHGIIDAVHEAGGSVGCGWVARRLGGLNEDVLCRYMRAGVELGFLRFTGPSQWEKGSLQSKSFGLTRAGHLLRKGIEGSMRDFVLYVNEESRDAFRGAGLLAMKTGRSGFVEAFGQDHFEWHARRGEKQALFDGAMTALTPLQVIPLLGDWSPPAANATVCDIAGGQGHLLAMLLQHYPSLKGLLVDQPTLADRSQAYLAGRSVADRASFVAASLLEPLPADLATCDAFVLKLILHDWSDEQAASILRRLAEVARPGARLDIVELLVDEGYRAERSRAVISDIYMQANHGAKERTLWEFDELVRGAGLASGVRPVRLRSSVWLLQANF